MPESKIWSTPVADRKIREWVFKRDDYRCVFCKRPQGEIVLDVSHFWSRYVSSTRFLTENLDSVCRRDHFLIEHAKQGIYREFKLKQLGKEGYRQLQDTYYKSKITRREAIINLMKFLNDQS